MQKLQQLIDAAFGQQAERAPIAPSDAALEREKAFIAKTEKVEVLKEARMRADDVIDPPASLTFDVVRHRGSWRVAHRNRHSTPYPDQAAAVAAAMKTARKKLDLGHAVEVRLLRVDGKVVVQPLNDAADGSRE